MSALCKKKCRRKSVKYLSYGFIPSSASATKPMCPICMDVLADDSMKPSELKIHLETNHKEKKNEPVEYFRQRRDDFNGRKTMFQVLDSRASKVKDGLLASYGISKIIAKAGKPHNIGETVVLTIFVCSYLISYETECKCSYHFHPFMQLCSVTTH